MSDKGHDRMSKNTAVFDETGVEQVVVYKWCSLNIRYMFYISNFIKGKS